MSFSKILGLVLIIISSQSIAATTTYGKIVGIEARNWGLHIQTDFGFSMAGCGAVVGQTYMYDFVYNNAMNSSINAQVEVSLLFTAFAANKDIAFHIYDCNSIRPKIGFILVK